MLGFPPPHDTFPPHTPPRALRDEGMFLPLKDTPLLPLTLLSLTLSLTRVIYVW